jgi:hypothetical protein
VTAIKPAGTTYCSATCRNAANHEATRRDGRYDAQVRRAKQKRQEQALRNARPCPYCADLMTNQRRKQCGKPDCKRAFNADRMRQWNRDHKAATGQWYHRNYAEQQREYNRLRKETQPHWRERYPEAAALADARRRALLERALRAEPFAPRDVYERDQWTCGLCRLPVDPGLKWPHPMSASVDHIVPLSRGGDHMLTNVQCAHLNCNSRKGDQALVDLLGTLQDHTSKIIQS